MPPRALKLPTAEQLTKDPSLFDRLPVQAQQTLRDLLRAEASTIGLGTRFPDPVTFGMHFSGGAFLRAPHIDLLNEKLLQVYREGGRLLVSLPPGHGKSTLISTWFPLWVLTQDPTKLIGLICHTDRFASDWGYKARQIIEEQGEELRLKLSPDYGARNNWRLINGRGGMTCEGITGGMTGKRLNCLVLDDPIKTEVEASSELHRLRLKEMWQTVGLTRLEPGACVVCVATRWHEDDLIGYLKKQSESGGGLKFEVVHLPALAEANDILGRAEGEALWPARFPASVLEVIRDSGISPYNWAALYQQRPVPHGGGRIQESWWRYYTPSQLPAEFDVMLQSWDLSLKAGIGSDPACGQVWGRKGALFYLLAQELGNFTLPEIVRKVRAFQFRFPKAILKLIEDKAAGPALIQTLRVEMPGVVPVPAKESKEARVEAVQPVIEAGNVLLPLQWVNPADPGEGTVTPQWVKGFVHEWGAFPKGTHDDQVDAGTQALIRLLPGGWQYAHRAHEEALDDNFEVPNPLELQALQVKNWAKRKIEENDQRLDAEDEEAMAYLEGYGGEW